MKKQLSILIPTYNNVCVALVDVLSNQAMSIRGLEYEIIVADDGSDNISTKKINEQIGERKNCRYIMLDENIGRASIRNYLGHEARYDWLLFMDSDVNIDNNDFIKTYLHVPNDYLVVYGGVKIGMGRDHSIIKNNLRYMYEKDCEPRHTANVRSVYPYRSFRTTNFMIMKEVLNTCHFDPSITTYGYEDVLFGKSLCDNRIKIMHMDNPVTYTEYDDNTSFMAKTEEALQTLDILYDELRGYSGIVNLCSCIHSCHLGGIVRKIYSMKKNAWRRKLISKHPSLFLLKLYKIGYFISIHRFP